MYNRYVTERIPFCLQSIATFAVQRAQRSLPSHLSPMASLSRRREREDAREDAMRSINAEAEIIALKRKAASWGVNENEESISGFSGRWEALSNWFAATVMWRGEFYPSVEHGYQAAKAAAGGAQPDTVDAIRKAGSPKEAHALGQKLSLPPDWERRKVGVMEALVRDKFRRDAALRDRLLKSGVKNLIAANGWGETFWGVSGGGGGGGGGSSTSGSNQLGKLLMSLRAEAASGADVELWLESTFELEVFFSQYPLLKKNTCELEVFFSQYPSL